MDTHVLLRQGFMEKSHSQDALREEGAPTLFKNKAALPFCGTSKCFLPGHRADSTGFEKNKWP